MDRSCQDTSCKIKNRCKQSIKSKNLSRSCLTRSIWDNNLQYQGTNHFLISILQTWASRTFGNTRIYKCVSHVEDYSCLLLHMSVVQGSRQRRAQTDGWCGSIWKCQQFQAWENGGCLHEFLVDYSSKVYSFPKSDDNKC